MLDQLANTLGSATPCAFITKGENLQDDMKRLGYSILGTAHVPRRAFTLPKGEEKSKNGNGDSSSRKGSNNYVVTFATSPVNES
jgi:hypothetical protein